MLLDVVGCAMDVEMFFESGLMVEGERFLVSSLDMDDDLRAAGGGEPFVTSDALSQRRHCQLHSHHRVTSNHHFPT